MSYTDNDGQVHSVVAGAGKIVYLPAGAHNKIEAVGDVRLRVLVIERETLVGRVEHLVGESPGIYDPKADPEHGIEIDSLRGEVVSFNEAVVEPY